ncbi:helix-turn-helix transcriptional regulator [Spelaeicoccus albus]|uniref:Putative DNA-binding transcriptional regulator YafY n=1 Tax=Spelaeicoccus albus TaxID=1280376 RepID=A0A7Z0IJ37_9MICO|nr:YafY family protein [Spelaeicoccus albus]NYI69124.1 putative DNA-binding transcriptional regulator YafY [Spelaeicoccus albus]
MNRTDRLYALVDELRAVAPRPRSARWFADRFEVSARTIERDISALQQSGVPIWAEPGRTGGYCIDRARSMSPLNFTVDEALAVAIALGKMDGTPFHSSATAALRKVVAGMHQDDASRATTLASRVRLLGDDEPTPPASEAFATALSSGSVLRLVYRDRAGQSTERDVEPLGYIGKESHWYLIGWCRLRNGVRAFRWDRIASASATGERPARRAFRPEDLEIPYGELRPLGIE